MMHTSTQFMSKKGNKIHNLFTLYKNLFLLPQHHQSQYNNQTHCIEMKLKQKKEGGGGRGKKENKRLKGDKSTPPFTIFKVLGQKKKKRKSFSLLFCFVALWQETHTTSKIKH